jgi:hypothetical protein
VLLTSITSGILVGDYTIEGGSPAAVINVVALPLYLRDLVFLGRIDVETPLTGMTYGAPLAILIYTVIVVTGVVVLLRRYRWLER